MSVTRSETLELYHTMFPDRRVRRGVYLALWVLIGTLSAMFWRWFPPSDYPYTWWELHRVKVVLWLIWGGITPLILTLASRFRIEPPNALRNSIILMVASVVGTLLYLLVYAVILLANLSHVDHGNSFEEMLGFVLSVHSTFFLLVFWAMIGVEHALGYYRAYHDQRLQASRLETRLAEAQLTSLRLQLQPHFLFNSLHVLGALVRKGDTAKAIDMLNGIAELLRSSLAGVSRGEIPLREELELLGHYLEIVKIRFGRQLAISTSIDETTSEALVPGFLLQPIVENAVRHGIERTGGAGSISIAVTKRNGDLIIVVNNSGSGGEEPSTMSEGSFGIGLSNTSARLRTLYGDNHRIELESGSAGAASVTIELPFHTKTLAAHPA